MSNTLWLNCLVHDEPTEKIFTIHIEKDVRIISLKEKIKEYRRTLFAEVDAPDIVLWKAKIPYSDDIAEDIFQYDNEKLLNPIKKICDVFTEPPTDEFIHIIVENLPGKRLIIQLVNAKSLP